MGPKEPQFHRWVPNRAQHCRCYESSISLEFASLLRQNPKNRSWRRNTTTRFVFCYLLCAHQSHFRSSIPLLLLLQVIFYFAQPTTLLIWCMLRIRGCTKQHSTCIRVYTYFTTIIFSDPRIQIRCWQVIFASRSSPSAICYVLIISKSKTDPFLLRFHAFYFARIRRDTRAAKCELTTHKLQFSDRDFILP